MYSSQGLVLGSICDAFRCNVAEAVADHVDREPVLGENLRDVERTAMEF